MDRPFNIEDDDITVLVRQSIYFSFLFQETSLLCQNPKSPNQYLSCSPAMDVIACRTIDHAKLLSSIRDCDSQGILFHYSNFCCWKDSTAKNGDIGNPSQWILQLECRAMVEILKLRGSATIDEFMISNARAIEKDFVETGIKYLEETYQTFDRGDFRGSFVDAYDVFATGIAVLCLSRRSSRPMHGAGIIHKCTNILTLVAAEFPSLKAFHRVLWALSSVTPGNQIDDPILQNLPTVIPEGIQGLIKEFLS
jgi:hypothetical protein